MAENYSEMEISAEEFYEVINNSDKLIAVNFFAEWHMPCLMFFPVIEDLAEKMKDVRFVKMNIDDNQEVVEKHNVSTIPCLIIFRNGKEIAKIIGAQSIEIIEEKIKGCLITEN
ncbi:thioredoxin [Candidatus Pacearchaeota archaeon]|nr:thioredoxin [Candidatus Pacearchaeota archaeon]